MTPIEWPVLTERLSLSAYKPDDLDSLWSYERLPQVQRWLGWAPHSRDELRTAMESPSNNTTHVMVQLGSTGIGHIMIMPRHRAASRRQLARQPHVRAAAGGVVHSRSQPGPGLIMLLDLHCVRNLPNVAAGGQ